MTVALAVLMLVLPSLCVLVAARLPRRKRVAVWLVVRGEFGEGCGVLYAFNHRRSAWAKANELAWEDNTQDDRTTDGSPIRDGDTVWVNRYQVEYYKILCVNVH